MESKKIQSTPQTQQSNISKLTSTTGTQPLRISELRMQDIMMEVMQAIRAAKSTNETETLKQQQLNLNAIKDELNEQIDSLKRVADKL